MNAKRSHVGRCDTTNCAKPTAYVQILPGNRYFRYCEDHVPENVKRAAEKAEEKTK